MDRRCGAKEFLAHAAEDRLSTIPKHKIDQTEDWVEKVRAASVSFLPIPMR